ncbi:MAG: TerB family tellurite resistance protein, partial [Gammaproteobacteria bacterium]
SYALRNGYCLHIRYRVGRYFIDSESNVFYYSAREILFSITFSLYINLGVNMSENTIGAARELTAKWYYKELWGWDLDSICEGPVRETFLKSLMVCAAGDGELSDEERNWVLGRAAAAGAPDELLESLKTYPADEDINEVVGRTLATNKSRRAVVYFAIKAASADHEYGEEERAKIREMAASLGIPATEVAQLEILVAEEAVLKLKRISLCFPDGSPF